MTMTITWHAHEPPPASSFPWLTWWQACGGAVSTQDLWPGPVCGCCCGPRISWLVLTKSQVLVVCGGGLRTPTAGCSLHTSKWRHFPQSQYGDIYTHNIAIGIGISLEWRGLLIYYGNEFYTKVTWSLLLYFIAYCIQMWHWFMDHIPDHDEIESNEEPQNSPAVRHQGAQGVGQLLRLC